MKGEIKVGGILNIQIKEQELVYWLSVVYLVSKNKDLKQAITIAKMNIQGEDDKEDEREIIHTIGLLYKAQLGGTLIPPVSLTDMYTEIIKDI